MPPAGPMPAAGTVQVAFGRFLRRRGLDVPVQAVIAFTEAVALVGAERRAGVYWAGRATLVRRPEDLARYDAAFAAFFDAKAATVDVAPPPPSLVLAVDDEEADGPPDDAPDGDERDRADPDTVAVRFSRVEVLRHKDLGAATPEERAELHRLIARLRVAGAERRSRRTTPSARRHLRPDLRRTTRAALRTGGEPLRWHTREPRQRLRRLVLLVDVSGSMEPYARALVRFAHAAVLGRRHVEVFALGTRLTRVTRQLTEHDPDTALAAAARVVADWSGGTRLGDGLRRFNDDWGQRGMARGATVVILSDGWDRGEPDVMAEQMARLGRVAHRIIWVNPLKAAPGYAPLARGMAAALPHVDAFVEGHSLASLESLAEVLAS
ncbi:MAG: VWA domain-containing protein [Actinobacteria bacterium]|nr:VWA domain-containing protein [Actinomycetota bacterium]